MSCSGGNYSGVEFEDGTALVTGTWAGFTGELYDPLSGRSREARVRVPADMLRQAVLGEAFGVEVRVEVRVNGETYVPAPQNVRVVFPAAEDAVDSAAALAAEAGWAADGYRTVPAEQVWAETAEQRLARWQPASTT